MFDYSEYSKLRSIARKRIERAAQAGQATYTFIPTVAQIRKSGNEYYFMQKVQEYLAGQPTLTQIRKGATGSTYEFPQLPEIKKLSAEEKRARRNEQKRRSKAKRAVEQESIRRGEDIAKQHKKTGYLKALETVGKKFREKNIDIGFYLNTLSPAKAKMFVDYMEYRFSQGDYQSIYKVDTFVRDFGELIKRQYKAGDIVSDFETFLADQQLLKEKADNTNKYGLTSDEFDEAWTRFVKGK